MSTDSDRLAGTLAEVTAQTVMACALIAHHRVPTHVLVDRKTLADQWQSQLGVFLGLTKRQIGQIGVGRNRQSRIVDIATLRTMAHPDDPASVLPGRAWSLSTTAITYRPCRSKRSSVTLPFADGWD